MIPFSRSEPELVLMRRTEKVKSQDQDQDQDRCAKQNALYCHKA